MIETRTLLERMDDLEHDNNLLREKLSIIETDTVLLSRSFDMLGEKCTKMIAKINEFVGRWARVQ